MNAKLCGNPRSGTGLVGLCTVDLTRSTHKTEGYVLDLSNIAAHKTIFCQVTDVLLKIFFKMEVFV